MTDPIDPPTPAPLSSSELEAAIGAVDPFDSTAVKALLSRLYPFADILSDDGINQHCQLGQGRAVLEALAPDFVGEGEKRRLKECFEMPTAKIKDNPDLESRAWDIVSNPIYGTDEERRELIKSVEGAGIIGTLAQAKLQPPMTIRTKRPSWYRPFSPSSFRGQTPNLFETFETEWKVRPDSKEQTRTKNTIVNHQQPSK